MGNRRSLIAFTTAVLLGAGTALAVPDDWLGYCFWGAGLAALVFGSLAAASVKDKPDAGPGTAAKVALWLTVGTDRPTVRITDAQALICFFSALAFLVGLTLGAFGAVHT